MLALTALLAGPLVACAPGGETFVVEGTTSVSPSTTAPAADPNRQTTPGPVPTSAVGTIGLILVDESRGRTLPTRVHYPAASATSGLDLPPAAGVYPLVLMAHGYRLAPDAYDPLLTRLASRGYIVAAPVFPRTSPGGDGDRGDLVNQPADLAAVADLVVSESRRPGSLLPDVARAERIGVIGHDDGGLTAAAIAYNDVHRDTRVGAAVVLAGGASGFEGNWSVPSPPPLLAVHGSADPVTPPASSEALADLLPDAVPRYVVSVDGGDHVAPFTGDTTAGGLAPVIADFLDIHLQEHGELALLDRLRADANVPPLKLVAE